MKIRYILIAIIFTFFLGFNTVDASSINYNVRIDNELGFHETITYNVDKSDVKNDGTYDFLSSVVKDTIYFDLKEEIPYKKSVNKTNTGYTVVLRNDYASVFLSKSRIVKECFTEYKYNDTNNRFTFSASDFYCAHRADVINVSVTTDLDVISTNATSIEGNNYRWDNINKNFKIKFSANLPVMEEEPMDELTEESNNESDNQEDPNASQNKDTDEEKAPKHKTYNYILMIVLGASGLFVIILAAIVLKQKSSRINKL